MSNCQMLGFCKVIHRLEENWNILSIAQIKRPKMATTIFGAAIGITDILVIGIQMLSGTSFKIDWIWIVSKF